MKQVINITIETNLKDEELLEIVKDLENRSTPLLEEFGKIERLELANKRKTIIEINGVRQ